MRIGALIVTTGLPQTSGIAALLSEVGSICAGQRMISAFQCAEASLVTLVVGPENKKLERNLSQNGVIFLHREQDNADYFDSIQFGLRSLRHHFDRIFIVPGDTCLFLPSTLEKLISTSADVAIPTHQHLNGYPVLLSATAIDTLLELESMEQVRNAWECASIRMEYVPVEDPGTLIRSKDLSGRENLIHIQDAQLTRPVAEVALYSGGPLFDPRLSMLLHLVEQCRSVRDACTMMQISYSTAWNMLNHVEDELGFPLVTRIRGGSNGSGSELTEKGRTLLAAYDQFSSQINREAKARYREIFST